MSFNINHCPFCKIALAVIVHPIGTTYICNNIHYKYSSHYKSHYTVWINSDAVKYPHLYDTREVIAYPYLLITTGYEENAIFKLSETGRVYIDKFPLFELNSEHQVVKKVDSLLVFL